MSKSIELDLEDDMNIQNLINDYQNKINLYQGKINELIEYQEQK